jgi:cytochrome c biogenesis protein CcmG/thiol:disulfide interchange protein DsbE
VVEDHPDVPDSPGPSDSGGSDERSPRPKHTARWIAASILVITAGLVAVLATRPQAANQASSALVGKPAPGIDTATLNDFATVSGANLNLRSLRGRWVVVNFFASWCPPCQDEEPQLVSFAYQHKGTGQPEILGVVYDDTAGNARSFLRATGGTWTAIVDPGSLKIAYGVTGPPETFVVAPDGIVFEHFLGGVTTAGLDAAIARGTADGY